MEAASSRASVMRPLIHLHGRQLQTGTKMEPRQWEGKKLVLASSQNGGPWVLYAC